MTEKVALNGGYVWLVSDDLKRRWGEIPAAPLADLAARTTT